MQIDQVTDALKGDPGGDFCNLAIGEFLNYRLKVGVVEQAIRRQAFTRILEKIGRKRFYGKRPTKPKVFIQCSLRTSILVMHNEVIRIDVRLR
ncbi:hypothetical protein D3C75_1192230 [compost metagenome]